MKKKRQRSASLLPPIFLMVAMKAAERGKLRPPACKLVRACMDNLELLVRQSKTSRRPMWK